MSNNRSTAAASSSMSKQPTLVYASDFKLPAYLEHSAFYDQFYVASNPATAASSSSSTSHAVPAGAKGKQREQQQQQSFGSISHGQAPSGSQYPKQKQKRRIPLPCRLDQEQCCKRLLISNDFGLQFMPERDDQGREKVNTRDPDKDAASVRADAPIPPQTGVYYYEVEIISRGMKGYIGIGFTTRAVNLERLPGWNPESYGYHGDDGKAFACTGVGQTYGPKFGSGDIIGCGIDFTLRKAFFVKNGIWLGYIFDLSSPLGYADKGASNPTGNIARGNRADRATSSGNDPLQFYPTIGLQTIGETVKVNFGQAPFKFDINGFVKRRKQEQTDAILSTPIPRKLTQALSSTMSSRETTSHTSSTFDPAAAAAAAIASISNVTATNQQVHTSIAELVAGYLSHRGYSDTLRALRQQQSIESEAFNELLRPTTTSSSEMAGQSELPTTAAAKTGTGTGKLKKSKSGKASSAKTTNKASKLSARSTGDIDFGNINSTNLSLEQDEEMQSGIVPDEAKIVGSSETTSEAAATAGKPTKAFTDDYMLSDVVPPASSASKNVGDQAKEREEQEHQDMVQRQKICSAVRTGNIDAALADLQSYYPSVLEPPISTSTSEAANGKESEEETGNFDLLFRLRCQKFVELVLASHSGSATSPISAGSTADAEEQDMDVDDEGNDMEEEEQEDEEIASALIPSRRSTSIKASTRSRSPPHDSSKTGSISMEDVLSYGAELNALYASPPSTTHASSVLYNGDSQSRSQAKQHSQALRDHLSFVFSLVAYSDLHDLQGQIGEICSQDARETLAEDVNSAMLVSKGYPANPNLETLYRQSQAVRTVVGDVFHEGRAALVGDVV